MFMEEVTFELTGKEGFTLTRFDGGKDIPEGQIHEQNVRDGKAWMFMRNNKHFNFNGT